MWQAKVDSLNEGRVQKFGVVRHDAPVPFAEVLKLWRTDASFRSFFIGLLANSKFSAFRWETPPISRATAGRDFEFVLLNSPALDRPVDPTAFSTHFDSNNSNNVVTFPSLGGDAFMVVPCPVTPKSAYGHLASFVRNAPEPQNHKLWHAVGDAMERRLGAEPIWLSTAGMGVSWVHVRLDSRPKYYGFKPYKQTG